MYSVHQTFFYRNGDEERCLWVNTIDKNCMTLGQYMVLPDFEELLGRLPRKKGTPTQKNTAWHEMYMRSVAALKSPPAEEGKEGEEAETETQEPVSLSGGEALELLQRYDSQPVVYIGVPLDLWGMQKVEKSEVEEEKWQNFKAECQWAHKDLTAR